MCPKCNHLDGWRSYGGGTGCYHTMSSGPCNSDYEYCGCTHSFHHYDRCTGTDIVEKKNRDGYYYQEKIRCRDNVFDGYSGCKEHIGGLEQERIRLEADKRAEEYRKEHDQQILNAKIQEARLLLETNNFIVEPK